MEIIDNEVWLLLDDGRLISMNHVAARSWLDGERATLIPPERVGRDGGRFVLLPELAAVVTATLAPPERAVAARPRARTAG